MGSFSKVHWKPETRQCHQRDKILVKVILARVQEQEFNKICKSSGHETITGKLIKISWKQGWAYRWANTLVPSTVIGEQEPQTIITDDAEMCFEQIKLQQIYKNFNFQRGPNNYPFSSKANTIAFLWKLSSTTTQYIFRAFSDFKAFLYILIGGFS